MIILGFFFVLFFCYFSIKRMLGIASNVDPQVCFFMEKS